MAEVIQQEKHGKRRSRQASIRVDMTPMVDLGFLLITFFMFTTNFSKPNTMDVKLPAKNITGTKTEINEKNQITFILGKENRIFYHQSSAGKLNSENLKETEFTDAGITKIITEAYKNAPLQENFTVIIEPTQDANYKNFVDIFDNVSASQKLRYGISELKPWEKTVYQNISQ
ncbi:ExbD/TolR family protein [Chryseobacterium caseinilyticum]|uniref:Biopolymer transporter ExbD n=1 Tax=Chryseobacterium caseinilyticum TaxID=2771428 RepID=A0ABR8ZEP5_9FLAO|nr:biopolymer transporter ExbD [Chryseobacterium caseinilyticum]MBD8083762.1 biopolymer transporter ExbD [Chryseobacterium caseinilyticum]